MPSQTHTLNQRHFFFSHSISNTSSEMRDFLFPFKGNVIICNSIPIMIVYDHYLISGSYRYYSSLNDYTKYRINMISL